MDSHDLYKSLFPRSVRQRFPYLISCRQEIAIGTLIACFTCFALCIKATFPDDVVRLRANSWLKGLKGVAGCFREQRMKKSFHICN